MSSTRLVSRLPVALATTAVWALAAGSAMYWALQWGGAQRPVDVPVAAAGGLTIDEAAVARALGAQPDQPAVATNAELAGRLALRGVLTHGAGGAALIAVDGQPARPLRVGARLEGVDGDWRLRAVTPGAAVLAGGGHQLRLELPPTDDRPRSSPAQGPVTAPPSPMPTNGPIMGVPSPRAFPAR